MLIVPVEAPTGTVAKIKTSETTVNEVVETLMNAYNINVPVGISGNFRLGDIRHNHADLNAIESDLGLSVRAIIDTIVIASHSSLGQLVQLRFSEKK